MKAKSMKRLLSVVMTLTLLLSLAFPVYADDQNEGAADSAVTFEKVDNSEVSANLLKDRAVSTEGTESQTDYSDSEIVRVSIVLEDKSTIAAGYSTIDIADNAAAMTYRGNLENKQQSVTSAIEAVIGGNLDVVWNLTLAANIISANVAYGQIEQILAVDGVADVVIETEYKPAVVDTDLPDDPQMATSTSQIGNTVAYQEGYTGAGTRIAIIDTGIDSDHQSFDAGAYEYSLKQQAEKAGMDYDAYRNSLNLLTADEIAGKLDKLNIKDYPGTAADKLYQTSKSPFAYNYVDRDYDITHDNDTEGEHGSHVAGIAAANSYVPAADGGYKTALEAVYTQGVAPDAQIISMKVFGKNGGAYDSDYMVAIEDAIVLGCDSVNLSLGSANPGMTYSSTAEYESIMDTLTESDTIVTISTGNSSFWSANAYNPTGYLYDDGVSQDTVGSPGSYTNSLSVASVDNDGTTGTYINVGDSSIFYTETSEYSNTAMTTIAGEQEYVMIGSESAGAEADYFGELAEVLKGKVAVCYRGSSSFFEKANAAAGNGAIATIVCNNQPGTIAMNLEGYTYTAPCISITQADAAILLANAKEEKLGDITYYTGKLNISSDIKHVNFGSEYYTMSSFSSWGVPGSLTMKPEITAPGGNIYSVNGAIPGGTAYENMSGTSMAAPQVAGMSALVAQYIKENKLDEKTGLTIRTLTQSLLMSTARPLYEEANEGQLYSVLNQGAGLANVGDAVSATSYIMMNADATESYADGKVKVELGDDVEKKGTYSFSFTINSLSEKDENYSLFADLFTQDLFTYYANATAAENNDESDLANYMDLWTTPLAFSASWAVDGKALDPDMNLNGLDFNNDKLVNAEDGQLLLDYVTGKEKEIPRNKKNADIDGNGKIESYDAYLFFKALNTSSVVVPAGKSVTVSVTLTLTDAQKEYLNAAYPTGAYIEGFAYAEAQDTSEGVLGTNHSIPILGYYGNWTDPSMYDIVNYTEFADALAKGKATRDPYLINPYDETAAPFSNYVTVKYAGDSEEYWFGGNPVIFEEYDASKNAFNSANGDAFAAAYLALIRNAADGRLTITNLTTGEVEYGFTTGSVDGAFFYDAGGSWMYTQSSCDLSGWKAKGKEGDLYEIAITMAPEYYLKDDKTVDWDALGKGATLSIQFKIDNSAPEVTGVTGNILHVNDANEVTIKAQDNQNIAAMVLFDSTGADIQWLATGADAENGKFTVDTELADGVYLLQVYDYANNCSTYRIFLNKKETDVVDSVTVTPAALTVVKNTTAALSATVLPDTLTENGVTWTTSDENIATVNENGIVTGVNAGECTITATSKQDATKSASCTVTVKAYDITIKGALQDEDGNPLLFTWDMEHDKTWTKYADLETDISSIAWDWLDEANNTPLYQQNTNGFMYQVDPYTGKTLANTGSTNGFGAAVWDMDFNFYTYDSTGIPLIGGVYGSYLLLSPSPMDNTFTTGNDFAPLFDKYTKATRFVALTWGGTDVDDEGTRYDLMCALDNAGYLWYIGVNLTQEGIGLLPFGYSATDLVSARGLTFPTNDSNQFCSMVFDDNLDNLYLSYFTGATNEIYILSFNTTTKLYESTLLGNVGDAVWPTALFMVADNNSTNTANVEKVNPVVANMQPIGDVAFAVEGLSKTEITGGLNSVVSGGTERPAQLAAVEDEEISSNGNTVTLNITEDAVSTNGLVKVSYDANALKLKDAKINGNYTSYVSDEENGTFTLGYVALDGITAVATLTFETLECESKTTITVDHKEAGQSYGKAETLEATTPEHVYGEPEFSWDKDHNCTATFTCSTCGEKVTVKCDVTSEKTTESTCNNEGATVYTATVTFDGKTYTDTVTVAISANGHNYGEPEFSWDKDFNCTATFTCKEGDDTQVVKCDVTYTEKDGIRTYTATVTFNGKTYTTTTTEKIADKNSGVQTGDTAPIFSLCIALIVSLGCCLFVASRMRRRRS